MHPHACLARELTPAGHGHGDLHVFTDGSCKHGRATWAISIIQQYPYHGQSKYRRVGFAAGEVDGSLGACEQTAMDAEATAIIAMVDLMFTLTVTSMHRQQALGPPIHIMLQARQDTLLQGKRRHEF